VYPHQKQSRRCRKTSTTFRKGAYTIAEIASLLGESGLPVSLATLKSALSRTQKRGTMKARSVPGSVKGPTTAHRSTKEHSDEAARSDGGGFTHIEDSEVI